MAYTIILSIFASVTTFISKIFSIIFLDEFFSKKRDCTYCKKFNPLNVQTLLFGKNSLAHFENTTIFTAVQACIKLTQIFKRN